MTYSPIDRDRIKISLSREEALKFFGNGFSCLQNESKAGCILKGLLKKAFKDMGYRPKRCEVVAKALKNNQGGIDIYFSGCKKSYPKNNDFYILEFSGISQLAEAAQAVIFSMPEFKEHGKLYLIEGKYQLLLPCLCAQFEIYSLVREFSGKLYTDSLQKAVTEEHGRLILPDNAVRLVAKL